MISKRKSGFEEKYFKGKESSYFACLEYKTGNLSYLYKKKVFPVLNSNFSKGDKVLDIGCALGVLLSMLDKDGYKTFGVDISHFAINEAKKQTIADLQVYDVNQGLPYEDDSFAAVFALDLIEHLDSPRNFILETKRVLRNSGLLFIHTPNINSIFEKIFAQNWFGYKDKTHLYLFNRKSLKFLLEKAGFKVIVNETVFYPAPTFLRPFFEKTDLGGTVWIIARK